MRLLVITTLFPNETMPNHGIFVENRLRAVLDHRRCDVRVIAPVPWFPSRARVFGAYARFAAAPRRETRDGIEVLHPRYVIPPKIGMTYAVGALYRCLQAEIATLREEGWDFDLIDAHYFYPDGVAASKIAADLGKPLTITARGSDISHLPDFPAQRAMILDAAQSATHSIAVCEDLKQKMIALGADGQKISVLRNGVDPEVFRPLDRTAIRAKHRLEGPVLVSVGHLIARKGHDLVLQAFRDIDAATLLIVGAGPGKAALAALARKLGVGARVRFMGAVPHEQLCEIYNAADILVLGSTREGWPNVLLEAMACGTPVVAPPVGGCAEVVRAPEAGRITASRAPEDFRAAILELLDAPGSSREATRRYAEQHSWDETARGVWQVFDEALTPGSSPPLKQLPIHFVPLTQPADTPLKLLVTVDMEEAFDWESDGFLQNHVPPVPDLDGFHDMCSAAAIAPLHFITLPLIEDPDFGAYCKKRLEDGDADFGIQMHHWVIPPIETHLTPRESYQCNLPAPLHREKLAYLIKAFTTLFGRAPLCHRAGRYGVSQPVFNDLLEQGIRYDFSAAACCDLSSDGGPDYSALNSHPLMLDRNGERFFAIPVSAARTIRKFERFLPQPRALAGRFRPLPAIVKATTGVARLSPEDRTLSEMKNLARRLMKDNTGLATLSFHSTSLTPNSTPYCRTPEDVEAMLGKIFDCLSWFLKNGGEIVTFDEARAFLEQSAPRDRQSP